MEEVLDGMYVRVYGNLKSFQGPTIQQSIPPVNGALNYQGHPSTLVPNVSKVVNEEKYSVASQTSTVDIKPSGRNELPEDLFTVKYSAFPAPIPGWQMGAPPSMGVPVQYNNVMSIPSFPQPSKSTNPFDVINQPLLQFLQA
ncbi:hypothetical protein RYX36_030285 [Vicia faba]